ncbi:MAG: phosphotransferase [Alphaproteobacteria bacterium]|nr:phosphotransferase [Alphaproteobacteria bacterium]MCY4319944.1 phosphotransferase [Alphaproteobacteria bacterium]
MTRETEIAVFLAGSGWSRAQYEPLPGDASFRRYIRLRRDAETIMLMDAPPPKEDVRPFITVAARLRQLGLSAPEVQRSDPARGLLLVEDFGDDTFTRLLDRGESATELYLLATDALVALQHHGDAAAGFPFFGADEFLAGAELLLDWYLPAANRQTTDREGFRAAMLQTLAPVLAGPQTLMLRDFHVDNLVRLEGREGVAACGLLDFQDAAGGPPAYDLASLIEDARREIDGTVRRAVLARYRAAFPHAQDLERDIAVLGAQRHIRVLGTFVRLARRDRKQSYLRHLPRLRRMLERNLAHPALEPLAAWFRRQVDANLLIPAAE